MSAIVLPAVAAALVFAAVMVAAMTMIQYQRTASTRRSLALVLRIGAIHPADERVFHLADARSFARSTFSALADRLVTGPNRRLLRNHLDWAGRPTVDDLRATIDRKALLGLVGLALCLLLAFSRGGAAWLAPLAAIPAFFIPDLLVYNAGLKRTQEILLTLPDALDLLNLCVESGLSLQAGLSRVAATQSGPVAAEFGRVLREMQLGLSRAEAFEGLARRTRQEDLRRFVAAVLQVDRLGIPVASVLREQARDMRAKRHSRARELAQKVPVKILAPLMVCLLPALFIIILGPAVITALDVFVRR